MASRIDVATVERALGAHAPVLAERKPGERGAAVAAILRDRPDGAEVLLIRRAARVGDPWSGHMAFPGDAKIRPTRTRSRRRCARPTRRSDSISARPAVPSGASTTSRQSRAGAGSA